MIGKGRGERLKGSEEDADARSKQVSELKNARLLRRGA